MSYDLPYEPQNMVKEFHDTFAPDNRNHRLLDQIARREHLIEEEFYEVRDALNYLERTYFGETSSDMLEATEELAKELADLLYVVYGTADELGIPLQAVFETVHYSNMAKVWDDGTVHRNEYGKVIKPPTYKKPDLSFIHEYRV